MSIGFQVLKGGRWPQSPHFLGGKLLFMGVLVLSNACSSPSASEKTPAVKAVAAPVSIATTATKAAPAKTELQTYYSGTLGGTLAVRLCLLPTDSTVYGDYFYGLNGAGIALLGKRLSTGELRLREFTSKAHPNRPTAEFSLTPAPDGSLAGTWRTLPPARPRQLAVWLRPYVPPAVADCRVRVANEESGEPTITVPDAAATQFLRLQLRMLVAEDAGDPGTQSLDVEYADNCLLSVLLYSEMVGASVTPGVSHTLYDLTTGYSISVESEIDPQKVPALVAEANRRLQAQISRFINERRGDFLEEDSAGLHQQQYSRATFDSYYGGYLRDDSVRFYVGVEYAGMSSFVSKSYTDQFAPAFSFAEIQPYLLPESALRRLAPAARAGK